MLSDLGLELEPVKLNNLYNIPGSHKKSKRLGRGIGSGKGKTSGRGTKGQKARSGVAIKGFEGGQMPIIARLPKRGFNSLTRNKYTIVDIELFNFMLEEKFIEEGHEINKDFLVSLNIIKTDAEKVKLLGNAKLSKKLNFKLDAYSKSSAASVQEVGGTI
ncbi:MAG: 50S ribosomal protein L15 [Rickettsiaceae bacterium]|nr:50S ribosomal protein L15 [Rickettsiaceae bacterium]